ncbi:MAG TPA: hypothetical protein VH877_34275 [Polyangia bacterium]|nr:hypothetical protein [Polyangia bacterium]
MSNRPLALAVLFEHPDWFRPLFQELDRRGYPYRKLHADEHHFRATTPTEVGDAPALVFNRMSPSAWKRGRPGAIFYTAHYLGHLEALGVPVFNGIRTYTYEISKALQVSLLARLGLSVPRTEVVHRPELLAPAAASLGFPVLVKPNIGGSGAGITRYDRLEPLKDEVAAGRIPPSLDGTWLVQEYHPPAGRSIVRVETLEGRYLYGIRIHLEEGAGFDLCPADICRSTSGQALESAACPVEARKSGLTVEAYTPPAEVVAAVERIAQATHLDVGGIEYLESERDGQRYYYDINALSNFVADPVRVVGLDPTARLVDALIARARRTA